VLEELAFAFHAVVQAKALSQACGKEESGAWFVAALLNHLANMAFRRFFTVRQ
jgi:hypothetical protein